ncbi:MAG: CBS domain-containing protein [Fidelibacterota bacterium]|nr:MAG: CBS domain-containing protein [Candidatus Neomarinimicrobiota bacterium]
MAAAKDVTRIQELIYELKVGQVMVTNVITVSPSSRMSDLRDLLRNERISGVPVVDDEQLVGLVSLEDFITCLSDGEQDCCVAEQMSRDVKTLYNSDPLVHAVEEFEHYGYGRFPVLDRKTEQLVGIITKGDIVKGLLNKMEIDFHAEETARLKTEYSLEEIIADQSRFTFRYDIVGQDFDRAGETSSKLKTALARLGIAPEILRRVAIATYEAEMNAVIYTDGGKLAARVTPEKVVVEVEDAGPGIEDLEKAMEPGFSTAPNWVRELGFGAGMGLSNIKKCADQMQLDSKPGIGTHLMFSINHRRE